jgi:hypothetical protein
MLRGFTPVSEIWNEVFLMREPFVQTFGPGGLAPLLVTRQPIGCLARTMSGDNLSRKERGFRAAKHVSPEQDKELLKKLQ